MHKLNAKKRITQADVAQHAGVSQAMVSYVINETNVSIPKDTRQRILDAMKTLDYIPNVTAQRLRTNRTMTIAGIIPDITNPFYPTFERGIQDVVDKENYDFIIYNTDGRAEKEKKVLNSLMQGRVDGVVGVFFHLGFEDLKPLLKQDIAIVRLEARPKQTGDLALDNIFIDNIAAARAATTHLLEKRHRNIGILASRDGPSRFRIEGYKQALLATQIEVQDVYIALGSFDEEGGYAAMKNLLDLSKPPTAIFAVNDLMAMGGMVAIREAGLSVPNDFAVIGFDDIHSAKLLNPALSSVSQKQRNMGQRAAQMLFERLSGEIRGPGRSVEMPFQLVIRKSS